MAKYTKYLEFSTKERVAIKERDNYQCIFCQIGYKMPPAAVLEMDITDIMHYIPRSSMSLPQILEDIHDRICDECCKWPSQYPLATDDEAYNRMGEEHCDKCPVRRLI